MLNVRAGTFGAGSRSLRWRSCLVLPVAVALVAGMAPVAAAQADAPVIFVVDDVPAKGVLNCENKPAEYITIQAAVDAAAQSTLPGEKIVKVCPGVYKEYVVVPAAMSILGAQVGKDGRQRETVSTPLANESFLTGPDNPPPNGVPAGFFLTASAITIDGFYIGGFNAVLSSGVSGAAVHTNPAVGNHLIRNNMITGNTFGMNLHGSGGSIITRNQFRDNNQPGGASGTGIYSDQGLLNSSITENLFKGNRSQGIVLLGHSGTVAGVSISSNRFENNGRSIVLGRTSDLTIRNNVSEGSTEDGLTLEGGNVRTIIEGNRVAGSNSGLVFTNDYCCDSADAPAALNSGTLVRENDFSGNRQNGIWVKQDSVSGATIRENHLRVNTTGLRTFASATSDNNPTIVANRIFDNGAGVVNDSPSATAQAANNWWGCNEGPSNPDCDSAGLRVAFTPWIVMTVTANKSTLAPGETAVITADMTRTSNGGTVSGSSLPDDTVIRFMTEKGSLSESAVPLGPDGKASTVLTNNGVGGENRVTATLDNEVQGVMVFMNQPSPSPSSTPSPTPTPSTSVTPTPTPTPSVSASPTPTPTASVSASPSPTPTVSTSPAAPECSDGVDNDGDGATDFPDDSGCSEPADDFECCELDGPPVLSGPCEGYEEGSRTRLSSGGEVIVGTEGPDALEGTEGDDIICGLGGNDLISGLGGNDIIDGETGDDSARGGEGSDDLRGGAGKDELRGNGGDDVLSGGDQNDDLRGNAGADLLLGEGGFDVLRGGTGDDEGRGGAGNDTLQGFTGNDLLIGDAGNDTIKGAGGRDVLKGGKDDDVISGGKHRDRIRGGRGRDVCAGGPGNDNIRGCED